MIENNLLTVYVQARMGSERFPGKSFTKIHNKPSLQHLVESVLKYFAPSKIILLTSVKKENDCIRKFAQDFKLKCFSGSENNVALRFYNALLNNEEDYFIRISGDSPLFSCKELKGFIDNKKKLCSDIYSTVYKKSFPKGNNFEIIKRDTFLNAYKLFKTKDDFEHVTRFFYNNPDNYSIYSIYYKFQRSDINFCFDTSYDLENLNKIFNKFKKPHYHYSIEEKCVFYNQILNE